MFHAILRAVLSMPKKLSKSVRLRGGGGTIRAAGRYIVAALRELGPGRRRTRRLDREFDRKHRVDTCGCIPLSELHVHGENWVYGNRYEPAPIAEFDALIKALPVNHERFVFVDIGCGKGRAMFLASDYPFRQIIGIDLADELIDVCMQNIVSYRSDLQKCNKLEAHACDATAYELPPLPCIVYLANPFGAEVMGPVLDNIQRSLAAHPRELFIAYYYPVHRDLLDQANFLKRCASGCGYIIWRSCCEEECPNASGQVSRTWGGNS